MTNRIDVVYAENVTEMSRDMNYSLWTRLYMFVAGVANPKDRTLHFVTLMLRILITHLT